MIPALTLIDASIGRLRLGESNSSLDVETREWCGSLADDLDKALELLKRDACPPDVPMILNERGERTYSAFSRHDFGDVACGWPGRSTGPMPLWEPSEISPGRWQAIREVNDGLMSQRFFDNAVVENDYGMKERKAVVYDTIRACESRCFELNRRGNIGGRENPPPLGPSMSQWPSPSDRHEPER
jgi:hypothetical protein